MNQYQDSDSYETPRWIINRLQRALGDGQRELFDLDPAALPHQDHIAIQTFTKSDNGLSKSWQRPSIDTIWLNPPYSDPEPFLNKLATAVDPHDDHAATTGFALLKCDPSTDWFQNHLPTASTWCLFDQRLQFDNDHDASFPNILAVYGTVTDAIDDALAEFGTVITPQYETSPSTTQSHFKTKDEAPSTPTLDITHVRNNDSQPKTTQTPVKQLEPHDHLIIQPKLYVDSPIYQAIEVHIQRIDIQETIATLDAVGQTTNQTDVCLRLTAKQSTTTVEVAIDTNHWEPLPVETIYRILN